MRACSGAHPDDHVLPDGLAAFHHDDLEPPGDHEGPLTVLG
ncbi:hypothetical protein [Nocardioides sp.]|nr:hypothetical protein [Nocardioides sp.]